MPFQRRTNTCGTGDDGVDAVHATTGRPSGPAAISPGPLSAEGPLNPLPVAEPASSTQLEPFHTRTQR